MSITKTTQGSITVTGIQVYLDSLKRRHSARISCVSGKFIYYVDGRYFDEEEFNKSYPIIDPVPLRVHGANPDRTKNFIHNQKSY